MGAKERRAREHQALQQAILQAALALATAEGWQAVSIRKIAERIEYSFPKIYTVFASKEAILLELLRTGFRLATQELQAAQSSATDPETCLLHTVTAYWHFAMAHPQLYQVMHEMEGVSFGTHETPVEAREAFAVLRTPIAEILHSLRDRPPSEEELNRATDIFWSMLHGLVVLFMTRRLAGDVSRAEQILDEMAHLYLAGLGTRSQEPEDLV